METDQIADSKKERKITGKLIETSELTKKQELRMLDLLNLYFNNVSKNLFYKDLKEKQWVIIFNNSSNELQGFSTQTLLDIKVDGIKIRALFSGDTIIDKEYWGSRELPRVWGKLILSLIKKHQGSKLYWFYISKGFMTYMLMPRYFFNFYPKYDSQIPYFEKKVLDMLAFKKFGNGYDAGRGIVKIQSNYYLKKGVGHITHDLIIDPNIKFFKEKNPNYFLGEELACIVELTEENMKPIFRQLISG